MTVAYGQVEFTEDLTTIDIYVTLIGMTISIIIKVHPHGRHLFAYSADGGRTWGATVPRAVAHAEKSKRAALRGG